MVCGLTWCVRPSLVCGFAMTIAAQSGYTSRGVYGRPVADDKDRLWVGAMAEAYERWLAPAVFRPFALDMVRRVSAIAPHRVLELAAGTGVLTRELVAAVASAEVMATDLNEAMVEFGRRQVPGARWQQADAMDLPLRRRTLRPPLRPARLRSVTFAT